jgi:ABC-type multidrug transport system ATPase subunit
LVTFVSGLDAASTYEICFILMHYTRLNGMTRIISLLQPSPETVSLFDEIILLSEGRLIYVGPLEKVEAYFAKLGYVCPANVDIADFLQVIGRYLFRA